MFDVKNSFEPYLKEYQHNVETYVCEKLFGNRIYVGNFFPNFGETGFSPNSAEANTAADGVPDSAKMVRDARAEIFERIKTEENSEQEHMSAVSSLFYAECDARREARKIETKAQVALRECFCGDFVTASYEQLFGVD